MRFTLLSVASASSAGRVISSSTWAGSAFGYGIVDLDRREVDVGQERERQPRRGETAERRAMLSSTIPAVTG